MDESAATTLMFDVYRLPPDTQLLYRGETIVPLEPQAVRVLRYLVLNADRVVSKQELLDHAWPGACTTEDVLKKAASQIRRALGDEVARPRYLATYHRRGYRFVGSVRSAAKRPAKLAPQSAVPDPDYDQLVGRDAELGLLQAEYRRGAAGEGRCTLVLGEPGIGKTQLARHFQRWARAQGARCLHARFHDYRAGRPAPYEPFLDLLRAALEAPARRSRRDRAESLDLRRRTQERWNVVLPAELFAQHAPDAGVPAAGDRYRAIVPLSDCFARICAQEPVVLVLDDVQWADDVDRDVIADLMRNPHGGALTTLLLARREDAEAPDHALARWLRRQAAYRSFSTLALQPLREQDVRELVERAFGAVQGLDLFPGDLRQLHRISGGNPYFVTEMLRLLVAENVLRPDARSRGWRWSGVRDLRLPDTLVMSARGMLDRLDAPVRRALEQAAVIGDEFRLRTWAAVAGRGERELEPMLAQALRCGVLSEQDVSAGEDCRFAHTVLRQVLYDGLSPRRRRALHGTAAHALEVAHADDPDRVAAAIAVHCECAGDPQRCFDWSLRAYRAARRRWQWPLALEAAERAQRAAAGLAGRNAGRLPAAAALELGLALAESCCSLGRLKESETEAQRALDAACTLRAPRPEAAALLQLATTRIALGAYRQAGADAARAIATFEACGDADGAAQARLQHASATVALGGYGEAEALLAPVLASAGSGLAAAAAGVLGWARALQSRYDEAVPLLERALAGLRGGSDLRRRALLLRRLHWVELARGRCEQAIELALRARDDYRRVEDIGGEAKAHMGLGQACIAQGRYDDGIAWLQRTLDSLKHVGDSHCEAEALWLLGRAHGEAGRSEQALELLRRSLAMIRDIGDRDDEFRVLTDLARVQLAGGDAAGALPCAAQAVGIARELRNRDGLGAAQVEHARALQSGGRRAEALACARAAVELLEQTGSAERWRAWSALAALLDSPRESAAARARGEALRMQMRRPCAAAVPVP